MCSACKGAHYCSMECQKERLGCNFDDDHHCCVGGDHGHGRVAGDDEYGHLVILMVVVIIVIVMLMMKHFLQKFEQIWNSGGRPTVEPVWRPRIELLTSFGNFKANP